MSAPLPSGTGALVARCFLPFAAGYLMSYLLRGTNAVIAPQLSAEFGLTAADIGVLTSAYFAAFAAAQIPLGVLLDRFGPRRVNAALFAIASVGALVYARADSVETLALGRAQSPEHAHSVLALKSKTWMHQLVGQLARTGQQQQALGVQIEPSDRLPLALRELGQLAKDRGTVLRVIVGDDLAGRLVVGDHARRRRRDAHAQRLAIDLDRIAKLDALADVRRLVVDRNPAFQNQLLHLQPRPQTGLGQHFMQLGAFGLGREHPLGQLDLRVLLIGIELARHHVFKAVARARRRARGSTSGTTARRSQPRAHRARVRGTRPAGLPPLPSRRTAAASTSRSAASGIIRIGRRRCGCLL